MVPYLLLVLIKRLLVKLQNRLESFFALRNRYIPAMLILAILSIVNFFVNDYRLELLHKHGKIINRSGKQRMFSQKALLLAHLYTENNDTNILMELEHILDRMQNANNFLVSQALTPELQKIYVQENLKKDVDTFIAILKNFISSPFYENYYSYYDGQVLLQKLNKAVVLHEKDYENELKYVKFIEVILLFGMLGMLLLLIKLIFLPTSRLLENQTKKLNEANTTLKDELKRRNKKLQELEKTLSSYVIMSTTDLEGNILDVSDEFCRISGYTKEELIGQPHNIVRHPDMPKTVFREFWKTLEHGESFNGEIKNLAKDGSTFICESFAYPNFDDNGNIVSYTGLRKDVTAKNRLKELNKELEEKVKDKTKKLKELNETLKDQIKEKIAENTKQLQILQQQSKMASMGEMIGAIAHQWRQPLNAIGTSIQNLKYDYLEGKLKDEVYIKEFIDTNKQTIKFMSKTIDDFRSFFRLDKEKQNFFVLETTLSVIEMQSAQLKNHNIKIVLEGDEFEYYGFKSEYQQVILNLINNAKDILIEKQIQAPKIYIELKNKQITIMDNGGGVKDEIIDRIFEPYFTTKEQGRGTGMGLYMSKMIIEENMNGKLEVKNTQDGAMFILDFNQQDDKVMVDTKG